MRRRVSQPMSVFTLQAHKAPKVKATANISIFKLDTDFLNSRREALSFHLQHVRVLAGARHPIHT